MSAAGPPVLVVGSGVAGLAVAAHVRASGRVVTLLTKASVGVGATSWAQGGIAAALGPDDSPSDHRADTLAAGAGLCDGPAVEVLVVDGPRRVRELATWGARFDTDPDGGFALTREGGHGLRRIVHAGGDATGAEVERTLAAHVRGTPGIQLREQTFVRSLVVDDTGRVAGVELADGQVLEAAAVVLATGGLGQLYATTTNPPVSTADGLALAMRVGAEVADLEFVQFHPTALYVGPGARGQLPLVSEAMRGEGAVLVDPAGRRVTESGHPAGDLAPRDVVTRLMVRRMAELGVDHLYLDARGLGAELLAGRFPGILARARAAGIDPVLEPIPVVPAAHYSSGGVLTDLDGWTGVPGLYACGEVACTGVHGANRLASNSLLEGLVFAARIAASLCREPPGGRLGGATGTAGTPHPSPVRLATADGCPVPRALPAAGLPELRAAMSDGAGVRRSEESLAAVRKTLQTLTGGLAAPTVLSAPGTPLTPPPAGGPRAASPPAGPGVSADAADPRALEAANLALVGSVLVSVARARTETRGCHWREDFPDADPAWRVRLASRWQDGRLVTRRLGLP